MLRSFILRLMSEIHGKGSLSTQYECVGMKGSLYWLVIPTLGLLLQRHIIEKLSQHFAFMQKKQYFWRGGGRPQ